jgi:hypothetical protein
VNDPRRQLVQGQEVPGNGTVVIQRARSSSQWAATIKRQATAPSGLATMGVAFILVNPAQESALPAASMSQAVRRILHFA